MNKPLRKQDPLNMSYSQLKEEKARLNQVAWLDQEQSNRLDLVNDRLREFSTKSSVQTMY